MNYCCEECGFVFSRKGEAEECPFCNGHRIRPANADETERLQDLLRNRKK